MLQHGEKASIQEEYLCYGSTTDTKSNNQQPKNRKTMSYAEGLELAIKFGMEELYNELVENGATPLQAIMEWN